MATHTQTHPAICMDYPNPCHCLGLSNGRAGSRICLWHSWKPLFSHSFTTGMFPVWKWFSTFRATYTTQRLCHSLLQTTYVSPPIPDPPLLAYMFLKTPFIPYSFKIFKYVAPPETPLWPLSHSIQYWWMGHSYNSLLLGLNSIHHSINTTIQNELAHTLDNFI